MCALMFSKDEGIFVAVEFTVEAFEVPVYVHVAILLKDSVYYIFRRDTVILCCQL